MVQFIISGFRTTLPSLLSVIIVIIDIFDGHYYYIIIFFLFYYTIATYTNRCLFKDIYCILMDPILHIGA